MTRLFQRKRTTSHRGRLRTLTEPISRKRRCRTRRRCQVQTILSGVRTSSSVLCDRCRVDRWLFGHLCQHESDNERHRSVLAKELAAGEHARIIVRSDGEPAKLACACAAAAVGDAPLEVVQEQVSRGQSSGDGLAEGDVKELKAKTRTLATCSRSTVETSYRPRDRDVQAWPVQRRKAAVDWEQCQHL